MRKLSFVVPLFNEAESLETLYQEIKSAVSSLENFRFEIIFINDGSTDNSLEIIKNLRLSDDRIEIISLRKNLGKSVALSQGFRKSTGDFIVTLDADLQDDPANLKNFIEKLDEDFDCVVGWKKDRYDPISKTIPSKVFNFFVRNSSQVKLHDFNCGFKVFRKEVVKELRLYGELYRFIPVLIAQKGFEVTEIPVSHRSRKYGKSKYGWTRLIRGGFDFLTIMFLLTFGQKPLHLFGALGIFTTTFGVIFGIYLSILHFQGNTIGNRPLLLLAILLIVVGVQTVLAGLIAELVVSRSKSEERIPVDYETTKRK